MFFGALRNGELLPSGKNDISGLHVTHVQCDENFLQIFTDRSKPNSEGVPG